MKTLTEEFREEIAGKSTKDREPIRALWHAAARRYLSLMGITSDPLPPITPDANGVEVWPVDMLGGCVWKSRSIAELSDLYRSTKPKARGRRPNAVSGLDQTSPSA